MKSDTIVSVNCVHGIDTRFCAVCNKASRDTRSKSAIGTVSLDEILRFLKDAQVRATAGAVAEVLGVPPRALASRLGSRPEASWVVDESDPTVQQRGEVVASGRALLLRMAARRSDR